jgi:drug/metabolite transporter (DMT)-like permease
MITHYRNRALQQLGLSILFLVLLFFLVRVQLHGIPKVVVAIVCVLLGTFSFYFYGVGSVTLAKAKGYDDTVVLAIIVVGFLCLAGLLYVIPLIILFGLKDRTKRRRHSRAREPEITRRNPPAKLPPLRE